MRCNVLVLLAIASCGLASCERTPEQPHASLSVGALLSGLADPRFEQASEQRELAFPADHGPRPEFQSEWWYFTGNVQAEERELAYQLTFFRRALDFDAPRLDSDWAARDAYMAHFALTDVRTGRFHAFERFERAALGLAGARAAPWSVWLRDWRASGDLDAGSVRLEARADGCAIDLELTADSALVLHGDRGFSRKGPAGAGASHYYSIPRWTTRGTLELDGLRHDVRGASWFDREFFTAALAPAQVGWDWFALRFDDGSALMLFHVRTAGASSGRGGTWIAASGAARALRPEEFELEPLTTWQSPSSAAAYPVRWRVRLAEPALELLVEARTQNCELALGVRYWEGPVRASGTLPGAGFMELTGY